MIHTKPHLPPLVQMFDRIKDREYTKHYSGFIFSHDEVVRVERLENHLELLIQSQRMPDKIFFNGKEVTLTFV